MQVSSRTAKGERVDCISDTASGTGRSNTATGTDPVSGSRHPGTFPAKGEVSAGGNGGGGALATRAGERAILCPLSNGDQSVQVSLQTAEATHHWDRPFFGPSFSVRKKF
jgi:hypothetical protein